MRVLDSVERVPESVERFQDSVERVPEVKKSFLDTVVKREFQRVLYIVDTFRGCR